MRILLVEDDRALNRSLVKLLKTQNYFVAGKKKVKN